MLSEENQARNQIKSLKKAVEALEREMIRESLKETCWHRGKAAALLQIPRRTLQRKMLKYGFREKQI